MVATQNYKCGGFVPDEKHHVLETILDRIAGGTPPNPQSPQPPGVDQSAWAKNVEQKRLTPDMTVHHVGLSVFGETRSLSDLPASTEPIDIARQKIAHIILNE